MEENQPNGFCEKKKEPAPDCANCKEFSKDDVRDEFCASAIGFSSLCFRIFNRDEQTRGSWRRKVCQHYRGA